MRHSVPLLMLFFFVVIVVSCNKAEDELNINKDAVIEDIYTQLIQQEILTDIDLDMFRQNIIDAERLVDLSISYDSNSNKTSKTISVSAKSADVRSITIFEYIPKDVAESVSDIEFEIEPTQIINDDPLIMWHLEGYNQVEWEKFLKEWSQTYLVDKKHTRTGTTVILTNKYHRKGKFQSGIKSQLMISGITYGTYEDDSDWDEIVYGIFGPQYRVADWNDLKKYNEKDGDLLKLFDELGLTEYGNSAFITRNGEKKYSSSRYYFATRHEHNIPGSYLAHENIDNYLISLGSWNTKMRILVKRK